MDFAVSTKHQIKIKENEKIDKYLGLGQGAERAVGHKVDSNTNRSYYTWNGLPKFGKKSGGIGDQRKNRDHPKHRIVEIGENIQKRLGDQKRLAVT